MKLEAKQVEKTLELAKLSLEIEDISFYQTHMDEIVSLFNSLSEIPTEGVEPLYNPSTDQTSEVNLRKDDTNYNKSGVVHLKNSPDQKGDFYKVPSYGSEGDE